MSADEARSCGLVSRVFPDKETLMAGAMEVAGDRKPEPRCCPRNQNQPPLRPRPQREGGLGTCGFVEHEHAAD
ncbi:hypothetical protein SRHO_G00243730 [Serrasalmus rhombeus]